MKKYVLAVLAAFFIVAGIMTMIGYSTWKATLAGTVAAFIVAAVMWFWEFIVIPLWRGIKAAAGID